MAIHYLFFGKVQGVFFRAFVKKSALQLGVTGFARNLPDGSVEAVLQGKEILVKRIVEKLRAGPPLSAVESVDAKEIKPPKKFSSFEILH